MVTASSERPPAKILWGGAAMALATCWQRAVCFATLWVNSVAADCQSDGAHLGPERLADTPVRTLQNLTLIELDGLRYPADQIQGYSLGAFTVHGKLEAEVVLEENKSACLCAASGTARERGFMAEIYHAIDGTDLLPYKRGPSCQKHYRLAESADVQKAGFTDVIIDKGVEPANGILSTDYVKTMQYLFVHTVTRNESGNQETDAEMFAVIACSSSTAGWITITSAAEEAEFTAWWSAIRTIPWPKSEYSQQRALCQMEHIPVTRKRKGYSASSSGHLEPHLGRPSPVQPEGRRPLYVPSSCCSSLGSASRLHEDAGTASKADDSAPVGGQTLSHCSPREHVCG